VPYLVDWDFASRQTGRRRFYRHLKKIVSGENMSLIRYHAGSVIVTSSRAIAEKIHNEARDCNAKRTEVYALGNFKQLKIPPPRRAMTAQELVASLRQSSLV
jgi:hypothetical protein